MMRHDEIEQDKTEMIGREGTQYNIGDRMERDMMEHDGIEHCTTRRDGTGKNTMIELDRT